MRIKKFEAKDFSEALALVKKEMGEGAIILSSETRNGLRRKVVVTAAVDHDMDLTIQNTEVKGQNTQTPRPLNISNSLPQYQHADIASLREEIGRLRKSIEYMRNMGYEISLLPEKKIILQFLRERSVSEEFALALCKKANNLDEIPSLIASDIKIHGSLIEEKKRIMLIGPTGVGKTTTIAKLSAHALKKGKSVAIVNLDTYRIGAIEQMRIYSKIMGIPMHIASNMDEVGNALSKYADRDIIFIDTTGKNPTEETYINEIRRICDRGFFIEVHLLISVNSDYNFMLKAHNYYSRVPVDYIAFTKVDEAVRYGSIYNLCVLYQKPVVYITTGQKVPGDIEFPSGKEIADLVLRQDSSGEEADYHVNQIPEKLGMQEAESL